MIRNKKDGHDAGVKMELIFMMNTNIDSKTSSPYHKDIVAYLASLDDQKRVKIMGDESMPQDASGFTKWDYENHFTKWDLDYEEVFDIDEAEDLTGLMLLVRLRYDDHKNDNMRAMAAKSVRKAVADLQELQKTFSEFSIVLYETSWWKRGFDTRVSIMDVEYKHNCNDLENDITFALFVSPRYKPKSARVLEIESYLTWLSPNTQLPILQDTMPAYGESIYYYEKGAFYEEHNNVINYRRMFGLIEGNYTKLLCIKELHWEIRGDEIKRASTAVAVREAVKELRQLQETSVVAFSIILHTTEETTKDVVVRVYVMDIDYGNDQALSDLEDCITFALCVAPAFKVNKNS